MKSEPQTVLAPASHERDWWRGAVIYQLYPRSFADANGDGVGDFAGMVERLPYVASLGVDAIWVSPFFRSPMKDFGYDVSDYRDVDPLFGTLQDFDTLVARAHELGLKVIVDQVLSHSSDQHPWFMQSRASRDNARADWYVWADPKADGTPPNNWLSIFGGSAWQWDTRRRQYYLHNFLASQPDLNFHNPEVQKQLLDDLRFWLDRGVDGFRFDACIFHFHDLKLRDNPPAERADTLSVPASNPYSFQRHLYDKTQPENIGFLQKIRNLLDEYGAASVGEIGDDDSIKTMAAYTSGGDKLHMAYSFNLLATESSAGYIRRQVEELEAQIADGWTSWSIGNHDVPRFLSRWGGVGATGDYTKVALAMLASLRGSVCWWQGDELALTEADIPYEKIQDPYGITFWPEFKGRDGCRTPMPWSRDLVHAGFSGGRPVEPWLPVPAEHAARAVDASEADPASPLHFMRRLLAWRKTQARLLRGGIRFVDAPEPVLAFYRTPDDGPELLCMFNLGRTAIEIAAPAPGLQQIMTRVDDHLEGTLAGEHITLPAHGFFYGQHSSV